MNLREYKIELRAQAKAYRSSIAPEEKSRMDRAITENVLKLRQYQQLHTLFTYVSMPEEVGTREIIRAALADGKRVAVPRCVAGKCEMVFHYIRSLDELHIGAFSVDEPSETLPEAKYEPGAFMLVPGLMMDRAGCRLGYGRGYYDRYLVNFPGQTVGLCYQSNLVSRLERGRFDLPMDVIVTETGICSVKKGKQ